MSISAKQVTAFLAVAEQENFTRAATQLNITQPTLSAQISDLETILGTQLFDRTKRGALLTAVGRELLPVAARIREDLDLMQMVSSDMSLLLRGKVKVACSTVIASTLLVAIANRFETSFPGIRVEIIDTDEQSLIDLVRSEEVEFAIATEVDPEPRISQRKIGQDQLEAYVPHNHPLAELDRVSWADIAREPLVLLHKGNPIRKIVGRTAGRLGLLLNMAYEVSFGSTALAMVDCGRAVTILPTNAQQIIGGHNCVSIPLVGPSVFRKVVTMSLSNRSISPAAKEFQAYCTNEFVESYKAKHG